MNIRQAQKTSAAFMCSQLSGFFSFSTSSLLPPPHPKIKFHLEIDGAQTKCSFSFSDAGNHFPFVYFLSWLRSPDSSFLPSEIKHFLYHKKLQLSASLICRGGDGRSNKQLILQKYCLFQN